jgi:hypothetical protein
MLTEIRDNTKPLCARHMDKIMLGINSSKEFEMAERFHFLLTLPFSQ